MKLGAFVTGAMIMDCLFVGRYGSEIYTVSARRTIRGVCNTHTLCTLLRNLYSTPDYFFHVALILCPDMAALTIVWLWVY